MYRPLRPFMLVLALLVLAALILEHLNGRFWLNDFRVYYMAADNLRHGLPYYGVVFGEDTGLYKYLPFPLWFFVPYTWLSYTVAGTLHFLLMGILLGACFVVLERSLVLGMGPLPKPSWRSAAGLLCTAVLFARELHLGNINTGLMFLAFWGVERQLSGKPVQAGLAWGVAWLIKPYLLLMAVPLVVRREWKTLWYAGGAMFTGLLLPMVHDGPAGWWARLQEWGQAVARHNGTLESPDRIGAILQADLGIPASVGLDLAFIGAAVVLLAWITWRQTRHHAPDPPMDRAMELWTACALVPNLVITDQQHFMFALPLVLYVLAWLFVRQDKTVGMLFLVAMVLYATRSSDLWGRELEGWFTAHGVLGSGNLLLMGVAWLVHARRSARPALA
jgi:hypothetical protein